MLRSKSCPVRCVSLSAELTVGGENTQKLLRQALPAFEEDYQLQEALARCEVILRADEAAGIEQAPGTTRFVGNEVTGRIKTPRFAFFLTKLVSSFGVVEAVT